MFLALIVYSLLVNIVLFIMMFTSKQGKSQISSSIFGVIIFCVPNIALLVTLLARGAY